eukprot:1188537-Prorocentrum_minimum.AAC.1
MGNCQLLTEGRAGPEDWTASWANLRWAVCGRAREGEDDEAWGELDWGEDPQHEGRGSGRAGRSKKRDRNRRRKLAAERRATRNPDARCAPTRGGKQWSYRIIDAAREERVQTTEGRFTQRQWRVRWEGTDDEGRPWEPTWEPL